MVIRRLQDASLGIALPGSLRKATEITVGLCWAELLIHHITICFQMMTISPCASSRFSRLLHDSLSHRPAKDTSDNYTFETTGAAQRLFTEGGDVRIALIASFRFAMGPVSVDFTTNTSWAIVIVISFVLKWWIAIKSLCQFSLKSQLDRTAHYFQAWAIDNWNEWQLIAWTSIQYVKIWDVTLSWILRCHTLTFSTTRKTSNLGHCLVNIFLKWWNHTTTFADMCCKFVQLGSFRLTFKAKHQLGLQEQDEKCEIQNDIGHNVFCPTSFMYLAATRSIFSCEQLIQVAMRWNGNGITLPSLIGVSDACLGFLGHAISANYMNKLNQDPFSSMMVPSLCTHAGKLIRVWRMLLDDRFVLESISLTVVRQ